MQQILCIKRILPRKMRQEIADFITCPSYAWYVFKAPHFNLKHKKGSQLEGILGGGV